MAPRIDWTSLSNEWEKFWIAFRDEGNKGKVLNAFWNTRGGRGRYFHTGPSGLEFPRERYPVGDDGTENIYTTTPLDKLKENEMPERRLDYVEKEIHDLAIEELTEALRFTAEYLGPDILPAIDGWSWYDALVKHAPQKAEKFKTDQTLVDLREKLSRPNEVERVTAIHILIEDGGRTVMLGENAKIISCMIPKDSSSHIKVWVQDDSGSALRNYKFTLLGELNVVPEGSYFVQTVVDKDDHPWHVYAQKLEA